MSQNVFQSREKLDVEIFEDSSEASYVVAQEIADLVRSKEEKGENCVLGLATGSTPSQIYRLLVKEHKENGLSFKNVVTFNLDEYYPMDPESLQSYHRFMWESLFKHIDILKENVHIPDGTLPIEDIQRHCEEYEDKIAKLGPIDIQLLGLGRTGHIGFNESGSSLESKTRMIYLNNTTRVDAASDFFGEEHVPKRAITMGLSTIMKAKQIFLVAFGENKANAVKNSVEEPPSENCAASFLQHHKNTKLFVDSAASTGLTRVKSPWILGQIEWTKKNVRKAVIYLSLKTGKAIQRLIQDDYDENHLQDLVISRPAHEVNAEVFQHLLDTVTPFPGSSKHCLTTENNSSSQESRAPRVLIMSPHPDDDVISC